MIGYHIARLLSDRWVYYYRNKPYYYSRPTPFQRYLAELVYRDVYEECMYYVNTEEQIRQWMIPYYWNDDKEKRLVGLQEDLEELKVKLYMYKFKGKEGDLVRKKIGECKGLIGDLLREKHRFDDLTCEYIADTEKTKFLIKNCLSDDPTQEEFEYLAFQISNDMLSDNELRQIAKSSQWKSYWSLKNILTDTINLTEEQRNLVGWSKMYDNIMEHPNCPEEEVIEDDDMLDGWIILQKREREKGKFKREVEGLISKHANAGEIFIPVDKKNAKKVEGLNDEEARRRLVERRKYLKEHGIVSEGDMPDTKRDLQMALNRGGR